MGLAASQARFLGLTARKSNTEYEVQQINQARTALSNEVMGLYEKYNDLDVPTPPSVNDYMTTVYSIDSSYENYEIGQFTKIIDGEYAGYYDVTLNWNKDIAKAYNYTAQDTIVTAKQSGNSYSYLSLQLGLDSYIYDEKDPENSTITKITGEYEKYQGLSTVMKSLGKEDGTYYMYIKNGTAYYTPETDLADTFANQENQEKYYGPYLFYYQGAQRTTETANAKAALTQESNGRLNTIQIIASDDLPELVGQTYSISTSQRQDEMKYEDAMNQYEYDKMVYEREVEKINKETEKIQEQDRTLELQINQLDTEQNAIATEMDSVKKVIEDTMEAVFKTFSG